LIKSNLYIAEINQITPAERKQMVKANVTATNICLTCNVRYQKYVFKMFFKASPESTPLIFLPCQHQPKSMPN